MSLDGFIAGPGDDINWMNDYFGPNPTSENVLGRIGAVLIGVNTYNGAKTETGKVYDGAWTGPQFVLTHAAPANAAPGFTFVDGDIGEAIRQVKAAAGDKYALIIGATTAKQVLEVGFLDEILVHMVPILLGDGVRLFAEPGGTKIKLDRIGLTQTPQVTNLWFRVKYYLTKAHGGLLIPYKGINYSTQIHRKPIFN
jgi:dihydrofolate reductase